MGAHAASIYLQERPNLFRGSVFRDLYMILSTLVTQVLQIVAAETLADGENFGADSEILSFAELVNTQEASLLFFVQNLDESSPVAVLNSLPWKHVPFMKHWE